MKKRDCSRPQLATPSGEPLSTGFILIHFRISPAIDAAAAAVNVLLHQQLLVMQ
jgi:hypothetical protein